ncbi:hypothetical protein Y032_0198g1609 [Ancylostoma ceylanicum]|nr:hypothetical protein Y032_0198g1609 [Ancylostoma ceylanicum]
MLKTPVTSITGSEVERLVNYRPLGIVIVIVLCMLISLCVYGHLPSARVASGRCAILNLVEKSQARFKSCSNSN